MDAACVCRLNNDMLLWEPVAPAPVTVSHDPYGQPGTIDLNVYNQLLHTGEHFEMAKSALQMGMLSLTFVMVSLNLTLSALPAIYFL